MKGDFTRARFDSAKGYTRVLRQQGRVDLDSDWNEQVAIQQHLLRTLIVDLIGPAAGPADQCGFGLADPAAAGIDPSLGDFLVGAGRYYAGGLLVENPAAFAWSRQPWADPKAKLEDGKTYLAYLDVWERHVTYIDDPTLREIALGGPDTCTRAQVVWQVRTMPADKAEPTASPAEVEVLTERLALLDKQIAAAKEGADVAALKSERTKISNQLKKLQGATAPKEAPGTAPTAPGAPPKTKDENADRCQALIASLNAWQSGELAARVRPADPSDTPCVLPPESRYRGLENQLYRVEIHETGDTDDASAVPTFKWSRDNGSVVTSALTTNGKTLYVDSARGFTANCWVEILTEAQDAQGLGGFTAQVTGVDGDTLTLDTALPTLDATTNPRARRWDSAPTKIVPGTADSNWLPIEDGIEVRFTAGKYRAGDYWLIPARVAAGKGAGGIEWPTTATGDQADCPPRGVAHFYAPLFVITATDAKPFANLVEDCRCRIARLPCLGAETVQKTPDK